MRAVLVFAIIILIGAGIGYLLNKESRINGILIGGILAAFLGSMLYINELKKQS